MRCPQRTIAALLSLGLAALHAQSPAPAPAPTSVVVFSDFQCPYSADLFFTLEKYQADHPNQIRILYKQAPLPIHPDAMLAHRAALAAGMQGRYNQMAELLYANESHQDRAAILSYAAKLHLDVARFRRDLASAAVTAKLNADLQESEAFNITQTPTLWVNGKTLTGVQSAQSFAQALLPTASNLATAITTAADSNTALSPDLAAQIVTDPLAQQGPANAPLTIVEFTDFQCPFCRAAVAPLEQLMAARGREVRWIFRAFPLDIHPDAEIAAEAALAAGEQGKFWQMHDILFSHQSALTPADLHGYAEQLHLDTHLFDQALETHKFAGEIAADRALGTRAGVEGTPTFFVDGQPLVGIQQLPELNQLADAAIARSRLHPTAAATPVVAAATPDQQVLGPATPTPVTLTWFVDVRSPLAARQAELVQSLNTKYQGRVRVLFRAFPLDQHVDGRLGSAALLAALQQNKFWPMFDAIAQRRDTLDRDKLIAIADTLSLNHADFANALDLAAEQVNQNISDGARRGILGAPVLFLNDQRIDGLQQPAIYTKILDAQLTAASTVQASN